MNLKIDHPFSGSMKRLKINRSLINETIESPDKHLILSANELEYEMTGKKSRGKDLIIELYVKKYVENDKDIYLFLMTRQSEEGYKHIFSGYKMNINLIPDVDAMSPIDILISFTNIFCLPFIFKGEKRKFVYRSILYPLKDGGIDIPIGIVPKGHKVRSVSFIKRTKEYWIILFHYILDLTKYYDWLYISRLV